MIISTSSIVAQSNRHLSPEPKNLQEGRLYKRSSNNASSLRANLVNTDCFWRGRSLGSLLDIGAARSAGVVAAGAHCLCRMVLGSLGLPVSEVQESDDDGDPVEVVGEDCAVRGRVCPAEQGVEDAPSTAAVQLRAAAL
jgi:hypothetical protein